jgi:SAM-dependent methyltransferase
MNEPKHNTPTYSTILGPAEYNEIIGQHRYIGAADRAIVQMLQWECEQGRERVLDFGCGPARLLPLMATVPKIELYGIDHDPIFVQFGRELLARQGLGSTVTIIEQDLLDHRPSEPYTTIYSSGVHHHLNKAEVERYLRQIYSLLAPGGCYILSDEFLPAYADEIGRRTRAAIWYSHIIDHAQRDGHPTLAIEEAKTLLDDLEEGSEGHGTKQPAQIEEILRSVGAINAYATNGSRTLAELYAGALLGRISKLQDGVSVSDPSMTLSRGDYKIDHRRLVTEVETAGFIVEGIQSYGPILTIGAMAVYILRKPR